MGRHRRRRLKSVEPTRLDASKALSDVASFTKYFESMSIPPIRRLLGRCSGSRRRRYTALAARILRTDKDCRNVHNRIAAVRVLVGGLPQTINVISRLVRDRSRPLSYEIHFTLFCYLDRLDLPADRRLRARVLQLVKEYLMTASSNRAHATWMAGDLLGDHWEAREAVVVLREVLTCSKHHAAREAAIHGLVYYVRLVALDRGRGVSPVDHRGAREAVAALHDIVMGTGDRRTRESAIGGLVECLKWVSPHQERSIRRLVKQLASQDASESIRDYAAWQLRLFGKGSKTRPRRRGR